MVSFPVPFTDMEIDTADGSGAVVTFGLMVVGFMFLYFAQDLGLNLKRTASQALGIGSDAQNNEQNAPNII